MFTLSWCVLGFLHYTSSAIAKFFINSKERTSQNDIRELYRSSNFIVVDKDFDVRINSDNPSHTITVENQIKTEYPVLADSRLGHSFRFVHRLDHATSGVLCVALNQRSAREASRLFQDRRVTKHYLALVRGHVNECPNHTLTIDVAIGRDGRDTSIHKYCTAEVGRSHCSDARAAQTKLVVLEYGEYSGQPATKLLLIPTTGRSHQLRVHCAHIGHVIVGDYIYSNRTDNAPYRMMLHAYRLIIPLKEEALDLRAEDPFLTETDQNWLCKEVVQTYEQSLC